MKILHVVQHFYPCSGGVEVYLYDLCRQLIERGHTSDVVCFNTCVYDFTRLPAMEYVGGIKIYRVPYLNLKYYKISPHVLKFLKHYDIIHIHSIGFLSDLLVLMKILHGKPLILHSHGAMFHTKKFALAKNLYFYGWSKLILKGINKVVAVSKNDEELFSKITSNIIFIPNALDLKAYRRIRRSTANNTFLHIGRLAKNKRIDNLLKTFAGLKPHLPQLRLHIVGDDWMGLRKSLEQLAKELEMEKNVIFTGKISEMEKLSLLAKAQFFVSSSEYEGFGISVLEAMASGLTVIVNDIESFRNFVEDGKNGFLVNFNNPDQASKQILGIMKKDLSEIPSRARKTAEDYDWQKIIKRIENVYMEANVG